MCAGSSMRVCVRTARGANSLMFVKLVRGCMHIRKEAEADICRLEGAGVEGTI